MRVLLVKLSSLGDVIHSLPAAWDIRSAYPQAQIDWVVEPAFADVLTMSAAVDRTITCSLRNWRKSGFDADARLSLREFWTQLRAFSYDWILDLQGLTKSGVVARMARLNKGGFRVAMANATNGSSYESPTAWLSDLAIEMPLHLSALDRARYLCGKALSYEPSSLVHFGLKTSDRAAPLIKPLAKGEVILIPGTSRVDKEWGFENWVDLAHRLHSSGLDVCFMHGNDAEESMVSDLKQRIPFAKVWPRQSLSSLAKQMIQCVGSIGVDSGPSHLSVALGMPHVQIYNFPTAWRTGPKGTQHQLCVYAEPSPSVQEVWNAWQKALDSSLHNDKILELQA